MSERARRAVWVGGGLLAALVLLYVGWRWFGGTRSAPVPDPRLTTVTPYRNVRPEVQYTGDAACAECHRDHAKSYRDHPMGRALAPVADVAALQRYDEARHNPFDADGFRYHVERQGDRIFHRETCQDADGRVLADTRVGIDFAIGSGTRAFSYLVARDGFLFQSPITWYSQREIWDLSPGYRDRRVGFERPIRAECLFCHCNQVEPVAHTINRYRQPLFRGHAIGCERCHGPGELHVARHRRGEAVQGLDETIVNPADLETPLREAICQQCHLQGAVRVVRRGLDVFAYRPGLPLEGFLSVFVRPPQFADHLLVSQVEQMHASRCYLESREPAKLGCTSCHDPHAVPAPEQKVAFYRNRCLACHKDQGCRLPEAQRRETAKDDSCVVCHMPRPETSDISHTAVTDHRIVRRAGAAARPGKPRRLGPGEIPLTHFHRGRLDLGDPELARDLGLALVDLSKDPSPVRGQLLQSAEPLLNAAVGRAPDDVVAWEARAQALWLQGRRPEALASCERALALVPTREQSLVNAATYAEDLNQREEAIAYWERARTVNPWDAVPRLRLARLWSEQKEWDRALAECEEVLRTNPASIEARLVRVAHHLEKGDRDRARAEFETVLALRPKDPAALRRWYDGKAR